MTIVRTTYDTATGGFRAESGTPYVDESFIATEGQTTFELATSIDATQNIDVWANGMRLFEGALNDWTRVTATDDIVTNDGLPNGTRLDVRVWDY